MASSAAKNTRTPKVEYSLSKRGQSLIPILDALCEWGEQHRQ